MFGAAQISGMSAAVSKARFAAFPCPIQYRGQNITGCATSLKTGSTLAEGGFMFSHDAIVRIPLAAAQNPVPAVGDQMRLFLPGGPPAGQPVRIEEILQHPTNPEWRLGVKAL